MKLDPVTLEILNNKVVAIADVRTLADIYVAVLDGYFGREP